MEAELQPSRRATWSGLGDADVHVWVVPLDVPSHLAPALVLALSEDEVARARRLRHPRDRARFVVARALLRTILAHYLDASAADLRFCYGSRGKPALELPDTSLSFNVSHSGPLGLIAVARHRAVGVDVERVNRDVDVARLSAFFSAREQADLSRLAPSRRRRAFFATWTRKEAFLKARADGLAMPLDTFAVSVEPDRPARLLAVGGCAGEAARWSMRALTPARSYVGALAAEGAVASVRLGWWSPPSSRGRTRARGG